MTDRAPTPLEPTFWAIIYEDVDLTRPEIFAGEGAREAAHKVYERRRMKWTCHLVCDGYDALESAHAALRARCEAMAGLLEEARISMCDARRIGKQQNG